LLPVLKRPYGHPKQRRETRLGQPGFLADFGDRRQVHYTTHLAELEFTKGKGARHRGCDVSS